jgi:hypothetical protein
MSPEQIDRTKIIAEINLIPEDKRKELYNLIHEFRIGLERSHNNVDEIMQFAGSWSDIPEEDFSDFCEEIEQRRQASSSRRISDETLFT